MKDFKEMLIPEGGEQPKVAMQTEQQEMLIEQKEMDALQKMKTSEAVNFEQQEMDAFSEKEKLGESKVIYYPDEGNGRHRSGKLGEYRIFADTRPSGSRYDIFADGKGK